MILVTGAGGKTGRAVLHALQRRGAPVSAFAHSPQGAAAAAQAGAARSFFGDFFDSLALNAAFAGAQVVYHICPNMHPAEVEVAEAVLTAARVAGVRRVVYHSVLHPQVEAMPHHWKKLRVEELLFTSGIPYTILQPCAYMQNILGYWNDIHRKGEYAVPYAPETRLSLVDLEDVAEAAAEVLLDEKYAAGVYELAGPQALSVTETVEIISEVTGQPVSVKTLDRSVWEAQVQAAGMREYTLDTLLKMFLYYENNGFTGSPCVLEWLLGRRPRDFTRYIQQLAFEGEDRG
jgi:NAD(P)H dehydrogenase (quinone)